MFEASKNYIIVVFAVLLAISGMSLVGLKKALVKSEETVVELRVTIGSQAAAIHQLNQNSEDKNQLVTMFESKFKELRALDHSKLLEVAEAMKKVEEMTTKNVGLSNRILASTPKSDDLCQEADALINLYIDEIKRMAE